MLQVTQAAARALAETRQEQGLPDTYGVRVFGQPRSEGQMAVGLSFAEAPAADDQVTEEGGTRVFVASEVAEPLDSSALDIEPTADGMKLILTEQGTKKS